MRGPHTLKSNWEALWTAVGQNHNHAALIWNERTRAELREALEAEEALLRLGRGRVSQGSGRYPSWNYSEFRVVYRSLAHHLCIAGVYLKILVDSAAQGSVERLAAPKDFFNALYHRFLCSADEGLRLACDTTLLDVSRREADDWNVAALVEGDPEAERELCVQAMAAVYSVHAAAIGPFDGVPHATLLMDRTRSRPLQHRLLCLLQSLLCPRGIATEAPVLRVASMNATAFVDHGGVELLVDVLAAAHEGRDLTPIAGHQTNLLAANSFAEAPKEWFVFPFGPHAAERAGAGLPPSQICL